MRIAKKILLLLAVFAALAVSSRAGAPIQGTYKSSAGQVMAGRYAESFANAGEFLTPGNVMTTESWNGASLATQYFFSCPQLVSVNLVQDNTGGTGNGSIIWSKVYLGGAFFMNGAGEAWDGGDATYSGVIDTYTERVTVLFIGGVRVSATSNIEGSGRFNGFPNACISWIANGVDVAGAKPAGFPDYVDSSCNPNRVFGRFGNRTDYTINVIPCVVPVEDATWGHIKALYE
ncbi:MAG: hypothetical protein ACE5EO_00295 [Candidatus Krumholzibacteriia bacterium]